MLTAHDPSLSSPKTDHTGSTIFHLPELDILRFVAFLMVFLVHAIGPFGQRLNHFYRPIGARGVDLFFVLSAYLITSILLREKVKMGRISVRHFYIRRILRIWPLYFAFLILLAPRFVPQHSARATLAMFIFLGNWFPLFPGIRPEHLWSISMEEQFYAAWPVVMRVSKRWAVTACFGLLLVGISSRWFMLHFHLAQSHNNMFNKWTFTRIDGIVFGSLLAFLGVPRLPRISAWAVLCAGATAILAAPLAPGALQLTVAVAGCAGLLVAFVSLKMRNRYLEHLGKISYGLYLFHFVVLQVFRSFIYQGTSFRWVFATTGALLVTILVAWCSYRWFESPFLRLKDRFAVVHRG